MTTEPYTPDEAELIGCYAGALEEQAGEDYATAKADAERGIAKVKADALREAAADMDNTDDPDAIHIANGDADLWLKARADRIESGDGQ